MSQSNALDKEISPDLQISYKAEFSHGNIVEKYLDEVGHLLKMLLVTNQVMLEESEDDSLIQSLSGNSSNDLNTISSLTSKLRTLFDINGQFRHKNIIHTSPKMLLNEVKDKSKSKVSIERMDLNQMFINVDHEIMVSAFLAIVEVLGDKTNEPLDISYSQEPEESIFEFRGGNSILTDSLNGAYALELLRSMNARVKWTAGNVTIAFKSFQG